jgi:ABC-type transport system involved in multi-copper enzyme maturation permease subunit
MGVLASLARLTYSECQRRPFVYVVAAAVSLLALASHLFAAFSFGAGDLEATNLALSAVFLAGLLHAMFLGSSLVRNDLERGTLGLVLTKPVGHGLYLLGRLGGLVASAATLCVLVAVATLGIALIPVGGARADIVGGELFSGWLRALLPIIVLEGAALAASTVTSRTFGPVVLVALFVAGSLAGDGGLGLLLPDFSVFGLEAGARPSLPLLGAYAATFTGVFFLVAYVTLVSRRPLRSQG